MGGTLHKWSTRFSCLERWTNGKYSVRSMALVTAVLEGGNYMFWPMHTNVAFVSAYSQNWKLNHKTHIINLDGDYDIFREWKLVKCLRQYFCLTYYYYAK